MDAGENNCERGSILGKMNTKDHRCQRARMLERTNARSKVFAVDAKGRGKKWLYLDVRFNVGSHVGFEYVAANKRVERWNQINYGGGESRVVSYQ